MAKAVSREREDLVEWEIEREKDSIEQNEVG